MERDPAGPEAAAERPAAVGAGSWFVQPDVSMRYEIRVCGPLLDSADLLDGGPVPGRRFAVVDGGVPATWLSAFRRYCADRGVELGVLVVPGGEPSKTPSTVLDIVSALDAFGLDRRNEPVLVVGGGALLDTGGFAASVYRRGVPFVKVPTTLLAYVDAAVGIKCGVNFGGTKNLVGAFAAPSLVLLDRTFFGSLPLREVSSGLGEILKLGLGRDAGLFERLESIAIDTLFRDKFRTGGGDLLLRAIDGMIAELEPNIMEDDLCRVVDLGHTFSQIYETDERAALRHGEAVALDLNLSCIIANRRGLLGDDETQRVAALTRRLGLPAAPPAVAPADLWHCVLERTRHRGGRQRVPLPRRIGEVVFVDDIGRGELERAHEALLASEPVPEEARAMGSSG